MGDMLDTMDTPMPTDFLTSESVPLMLIPTFSMEDMDTLDTVDTMDTPMPIAMLIMASALLMLNPRLMLTPTFSMVDMDMDTLDTVDTMDTPMLDMPTWDKL